MKYLKRTTYALVALAAFLVYWLWPFMFPADPNELMDITLKDGAVTQQFRIKRGYLQRPEDGPVRSLIVMNVGYPDMGLPPPWKQNEFHKRWRLVISFAYPRSTAEVLVQDWKERGHLPNLGPGFMRYVGPRDGYDTYESLPDKKTGQIFRTQVFTDPYGQLVSVDLWNNTTVSRARMLSNLELQYQGTFAYEGQPNDPKKVRNLMDNFIRQIVVPPLPATSATASNNTLKE